MRVECIPYLHTKATLFPFHVNDNVTMIDSFDGGISLAVLINYNHG